MPFCKSCGNKLDNDARFCPECGTPSAKQAEIKQVFTESDDYKTQKQNNPQIYGVINIENIPQGHIIDKRYEVISKVGQGGFGAVYRVKDTKLNIDKALKVLPESIVSDEEAMLDLKTEARTMIALNHQNIVRVYDFQETGGLKYIDMEYVDGKTLTKLKLEYENKTMPEDLVREYALQIAKALAYAHNNNVIHKDIKPQNVMINSKGEVKIMDFGIAETVRTSMSRLNQTSSSGTLVYMSPEQLKGKDVGKESDIYSFGAMLYELLTSNPPFCRGDVNYQILNEKPESIKHISAEFNTMIMKCLEKDYIQRYRDFEEIFSLICAYSSSERSNFADEKAKDINTLLTIKSNILQSEKSIDKESIQVPNNNTDNNKMKLIIIIFLFALIPLSMLIFFKEDEVSDKNFKPLIDMVYVEGGTFKMGTNDGESDEKPVHRVTVSSFYIGKYEVTQKQWVAIMGSNPSGFKGDNLPVESITWYQAVEFCNKLSQKEGLTPAYTINVTNVSCNWNANGYRLPTEAEWEYAARGGNKSKGFKYSGSDNIDEVAWYWQNSGDKHLSGEWDFDKVINNNCKIQAVGTKKANELGIYDMSGNVWEWCWDWYGLYSSGSKTNPRGSDGGSNRILRGGGWGFNAKGCRIADRNSHNPGNSNYYNGFRLLRSSN